MIKYTQPYFQKLIAANQLEEFIEELFRAMDLYKGKTTDNDVEYWYNYTIQCSGKLQGALQDFRMTMIRYEDLNVAKGQIRDGLMIVLKEMPAVVFEYASQTAEKTQKDSTVFDPNKPLSLREQVKIAQNESKWKYDVFFSFSSKDIDAARQMCEEVRGYGMRVFFSDDALRNRSGASFFETIQDALGTSKNFILYCTPNSMQSEWVRDEYETFYQQYTLKDRKTRIFIIFAGKDFHNDLVPVMFRRLQIAFSVNEIVDSLIDRSELERKQKELLQNKEAEAAEQKKKEEAQLQQSKEEQNRRNVELQNQKEEAAWQKAMETDTVESYKNYLATYPTGEHFTIAQRMLKKLESELALRQELERQRKEAEEKAELERLDNERKEAAFLAKQERLEKQRKEAEAIILPDFKNPAELEAEQKRLEKQRKETEAKQEQVRLEKKRQEAEAQAQAQQERLEKQYKEEEKVRLEQQRIEEAKKRETSQKVLPLYAEPKPFYQNKPVLFGGIGALVVAIIIMYAVFSGPKEDKEGETAKEINSIQSNENKTGSFTDSRDGKTYKTVVIGNQTWMAENLAYKAGSGCWAYDNDESNVAKYGYLYDWETACKVAPSGWHLPSDEEWKQLEMALGMCKTDADKINEYRGDPVGIKLKSTSGWSNNGNGNNSSGFTALPAGAFGGSSFRHVGQYASFWSSSPSGSVDAWTRGLYYDLGGVFLGDDSWAYGFSVRCVGN